MGAGAWDVAVVGGGAAGLTAAIFAARAGARVLVLETRRSLGAKILVSGGGRCNVLPAAAALADFSTSGSAKALRNVLFSWPLPAVTRFFAEELGVPLKQEATGKVFPVSDRAADVVAGLARELSRRGVALRLSSRVAALGRDDDGTWLRLEAGEVVRARRLVVACGGLSLPRSGSDGHGWRMLGAAGHTLAPPHPALVPLTANDPELAGLAGLSLAATLRLAGASAAGSAGADAAVVSGQALFTHRGLSGPAGLDISRHLTCAGAPSLPHARLRATWAMSAAAWDAALRAGRGTVGPLLRAHLPRRLADLCCLRAGVASDRPLAALDRAGRLGLVAQLADMPIPVTGSEGYARAEVTAGGIPLSELHLRSLQSRHLPGVHVAGEMVDVVGRLGGFNFLWAWVSGRRAGIAAAVES